MTHEARIRRIGWIAILAVCAALYLALHLMVHSVKSDLVHAERRIVQLEEQALLLETEFLTRSNQLQLARWNRVEFGYRPPEASQFIGAGRQLAALGTRRAPLPGADPEVRLASYTAGEAELAVSEAERGPVSPLTGKPVDPALLAPERAAADEDGPRLALLVPGGPRRVQIAGLAD